MGTNAENDKRIEQCDGQCRRTGSIRLFPGIRAHPFKDLSEQEWIYSSLAPIPFS